MISEKEISVVERIGQLVFTDKNGRTLRRNTCKTIIPEGWTGSMDRNENFNAHASYIARAIKMMYKDQIREARNKLSEMRIEFRLQDIRRRNKQF